MRRDALRDPALPSTRRWYRWAEGLGRAHAGPDRAVPGATSPETSVPEALAAFTRDAVVPGTTSARACDDMIAAARLVEHLPLTLEDRWMFAVAPCSAEDLEGFGARPRDVRGGVSSARARLGARHRASLGVYVSAHHAGRAFRSGAGARRVRPVPVVLAAMPERVPGARLRAGAAQAVRRRHRARAAAQRVREAPAQRQELAGYVDETKLARAAAETERLEAELEMAGFGAADDIDGVYGTVTFTPGGGLPCAREASKARARRRPKSASERGRSQKSAKGKERKPRERKKPLRVARRRANEKEANGRPRGSRRGPFVRGT